MELSVFFRPYFFVRGFIGRIYPQFIIYAKMINNVKHLEFLHKLTLKDTNILLELSVNTFRLKSLVPSLFSAILGITASWSEINACT